MLALCAIAIAVHHQAIVLGKEQRDVIQPAYLAGREAELKSYVMLAKHAIEHLYESGRTDDAALTEAKAILGRLDYGNDGYFFVYDLEGNLLVHPRKPELVGRNRLDYRDINGYPTIRMLIRQANEGGGFVQYATEKPSTGQPGVKLTYVIPLPDWGWVLGTGIYLDDVENILAKVDGQVADNNNDTLRWIGAVAFLGMVLIIFLGLMLNIRERRAAQEEERARVASELHDGICQRLVSIKLQIETGIIRLTELPGHDVLAQIPLEHIASELNDLLKEVREIARGLYPGILKDFGLTASLRQLAADMEDGATKIHFHMLGVPDGLSNSANLALYRVAQESLINVKRHAAASRILLSLEADKHCIRLTISDNGVGFSESRFPAGPKHGLGLRNMKNRMEEAGGELSITSSGGNTSVVATIPRTLLPNLLPYP